MNKKLKKLLVLGLGVFQIFTNAGQVIAVNAKNEVEIPENVLTQAEKVKENREAKLQEFQDEVKLYVVTKKGLRRMDDKFENKLMFYNGRMAIPIRDLANALGNTEIKWNQEHLMAVIKKAERTLILPLFKDVIYVNEKEVKMDTFTLLSEEDRSYLPIRTISENLGYKVEWVEGLKTAVLIEEGLKFDTSMLGNQQEDKKTTDLVENGVSYHIMQKDTLIHGIKKGTKLKLGLYQPKGEPIQDPNFDYKTNYLKFKEEHAADNNLILEYIEVDKSKYKSLKDYVPKDPNMKLFTSGKTLADDAQVAKNEYKTTGIRFGLAAGLENVRFMQSPDGNATHKGQVIYFNSEDDIIGISRAYDFLITLIPTMSKNLPEYKDGTRVSDYTIKNETSIKEMDTKGSLDYYGNKGAVKHDGNFLVNLDSLKDAKIKHIEEKLPYFNYGVSVNIKNPDIFGISFVFPNMYKENGDYYFNMYKNLMTFIFDDGYTLSVANGQLLYFSEKYKKDVGKDNLDLQGKTIKNVILWSMEDNKYEGIMMDMNIRIPYMGEIWN